MGDGSLLVILDRSRLEAFWSEQALLLEKKHSGNVTFSDSLALQAGLLHNFFGITLRVSEDKEDKISDKTEVEAIGATKKSEKAKVPKNRKRQLLLNRDF